MKSPKTFLLLSVIVAVLVLGVAYAAITNITLTVTGNVTATPDQGNFDVQFVAGSGKQVEGGVGSGTFTAVVDADSKYLSATLDVTGMTKKGDTATYTIDIKNNSGDLGTNLNLSTLTPVITNGDGSKATASEYFTVSSSLGDDSLAAGETTTLSIVINMIKTPIIDGIVGSFTFTITAEPTNA